MIQIDPQGRGTEPKTMPHIMDRRNELAGNLSLYQETYSIKKINELVDKLVEGDNKKDKILRVPGKVNKEDKEYQEDKEYKHIELTEDLDSESKLDRSPSFIQKMIACGEAQAEKFLEEPLPLVGARTD